MSQSLIDSVLGQANSTAKGGYIFNIVDLSGTGPLAQYGVSAVPATTSGVAQTGTRRFAMSQIGVLRGDTTLTAPADVAAINVMPPLAN